MSESKLQYDAIIIGSGQGGNPLAQQLAKRGEKVALVEKSFLGGTCINTGCTPTKTMIASAQIAHYARNATLWGIQGGDIQVDMPAVLRRKDEIVLGSRTSWEKKMDGAGQPHLYRGTAAFVGDKLVRVGQDTLQAKRVFIDTGMSPAVPPINGLSTIPFLTNESILELQEIPDHLVVLGGGYIGLEFGQMFRRFGSDVTVIQSASHILPKEDIDVTDELQRSLEQEGIVFKLKARVTKAEHVNTGVRIFAGGKSGPETVTGSHLLVAAGRTPNTKDLDLQQTGVQTDEKGFVIVDDRLKTTAPDIWAIGDVTGGPAFTHISYNDYQIIYGNLYEDKNLSTSSRILPYAVYTDPNLGRVGLTEAQARSSGRKLKVGKIPMTSVARARERSETQGLMKLVVDGDTDLVLGASILSAEGAELVQILSTLMLAEKPYTLLKGAIYIHPTLAEGFFSLMDSVKPA